MNKAHLESTEQQHFNFISYTACFMFSHTPLLNITEEVNLISYILFNTNKPMPFCASGQKIGTHNNNIKKINKYLYIC